MTMTFMLKIILNRLQPEAEEVIAEEQASFKAGRRTTEQIFNLRILGEKYPQHQQNLYHVFIDFKEAFDKLTLFNIFLERIMCEALDDHKGTISIGGRSITNFRFADDIVVNAEEGEKASVLVDRLDTTTTRYKMVIGPDKTKVMTNNLNGFQREIKIKGQRLEEVENFKYLGAIISNEGSKPEIPG